MGKASDDFVISSREIIAKHLPLKHPVFYYQLLSFYFSLYESKSVVWVFEVINVFVGGLFNLVTLFQDSKGMLWSKGYGKNTALCLTDWESLLRERAWLAQVDEDCRLQEGGGTEAASQSALANFRAVLCLVAWKKVKVKSYPTLCDPMDCSPPDSSVHGESPGKNTGVACHALLQGIFPTQGSNPGLPHCTADSLPVELPELPQLNNCVLRTSQVQSLVLEDTHTATSVTWTTTALLPRSSQSGVHVGLGKGDHFMWAQIISWSETLPTALPTPHPLQTFLLTTCPG